VREPLPALHCFFYDVAPQKQNLFIVDHLYDCQADPLEASEFSIFKAP
jgi:hypothetical protein